MKHRLHKLFAAFLAVMLLVSCLSLTAFAVEDEEEVKGDDVVETEETEETAKSTHTYELYQIFTGTFDDTKQVLSDMKWGQNAKVPAGETAGALVSDAVVKELQALSTSTSDSAKLEVIEKYVDLTTTPYKGADAQPTADADSNGYTYTGIVPGYYLIKDQDKSQGTDGYYTLYVVKAVGTTLFFEPKGNIPTVTKQVYEDGGWYSANSASIGEDVQYKLTGSVSSRIADFDAYYYKFTDTLSKGLTYKTVYTQDNEKGTLYLLKDGTYTTEAPVTGGGANDNSAKYADTANKYVANTDANLKVYLVNGTDEQDVTKYFYVGVGDYSETDGTTITVAIQDLKALLLVGEEKTETQTVKDDQGVESQKEVKTFVSDYTINSETKIVVKYTAVLNEHAVVADANTNEVKISYYNDPNNSGTGATNPPSDTPPTDEPKPEKDQPTGESEKAKTETYTTQLTITKVNDSEKILTGAEFTLSGNGVKQVLVTALVYEKADDGTYYLLNDGTYTTEPPVTGSSGQDNSDLYKDVNQKYKKVTKVTLKGEAQDETTVVGEVNDQGVVVFTGLGAGEYTLSETKTPSGYNTMSAIDFTISFDKTDKTFSSSRNDIATTDNLTFHAKILNHAGSSLPNTGGIGTTIFYVVGTVMILCAGVLLITKKRMAREQH
jgi:fimbrial isopeptide formation D2 family protein/LPXTG-motif cell wall-anchored protein